MSMRLWVISATTLGVLAACASGAPTSPTGPYGNPAATEPESSRPGDTATVVTPPAPAPQTVPPPMPPRKQFKLSAASSALVNQAQAQHKAGNSAVATATLERALRIEPDNPLLWLELARQNEDNGNPAQADSMARKALQLGSADPQVQSAAWRLIAQSLRSRGRNQEAADADRRASLAGV